MKRKKSIAASLVVLLLLANVSSAYALYYPASYYDARAYNWQEAGPYTSTYNCLAYALGYTDRWIWPWGSSNPTNSQVNAYMSYYGYNNVGYGYPIANAKIISYGTSSSICHFNKAFTNGSRAKWGSLELMNHTNYYPYKPSPGYGSPVTTYY